MNEICIVLFSFPFILLVILRQIGRDVEHLSITNAYPNVFFLCLLFFFSFSVFSLCYVGSWKDNQVVCIAVIISHLNCTKEDLC